jgi:single-strand DNA-binding protein
MLNKVMIIGRLGKDPETRYMPNGDAVCSFTTATSETWKDKTTGEKREQTEWHNIVAFRKLAEICSQYLTKGSLVYVSGRIKTEKWQDKEGNDRYTTKIYADEMKMLGSKDGQRTEQSSGDSETAAEQKQQRSAQPATNGSFDDFEDDIPF